MLYNKKTTMQVMNDFGPGEDDNGTNGDSDGCNV